MNQLRARLSQCFSRVFPALPAEQIGAATSRTVATWDSIAAISLVNVIEEEFNTQIDFEDMAELNSFDAFADYLTERVPAGD
jgi:acyl carrier protein